MKRLTTLLICLLVLSLTSGCWDNKELDEYGYVQAVAIDQGEDDRFVITTHFYNPSTKIEMGQSGNPASKGINISTSGETFLKPYERSLQNSAEKPNGIICVSF